MPLPPGWRQGGKGRTPESGQAWVFEVEHEDGRSGVFALKRLKNPKRRDRFAREVRTMQSLRDHGVTAVLEVVEADLDAERPHFVMPWCEESLQDAVNDGRYRGDAVGGLKVLVELAHALASIHEQGVAHRDLKPENVLRDAERLFLGDLGLVLQVDEDAERLTATEEAIGSRLYIAPENEAGVNDDLDQRPADFYAFGKIVWAVLAGRNPPARERHRERGSRLEDLLGDEYAPTGPLLDRLANPDPRARLANWTIVFGELEAFRRRLLGEPPLERVTTFDIAHALESARAIPNAPIIRDTIKGREATEDVKWWLIQTAAAMQEAAFAVAAQSLNDLTAATDQTYMFSITTAGIHPTELVEAGAPIKLPPGSVDRSDDATRRSIQFMHGHSPIGADVPELDLATYLSLDAADAWLYRIGFLRLYPPPDRMQQFRFPKSLLDRTWRVDGPYDVGLTQSTDAAAAFAADTAAVFLELAGRVLELIVSRADVTDDDAWT